jgi:hypothetical protein
MDFFAANKSKKWVINNCKRGKLPMCEVGNSFWVFGLHFIDYIFGANLVYV